MPDQAAVTPDRAVAILGAGSWGTALAVLIARNGLGVRLWDYNAGHLERLAKARENHRYLPGVRFPELIELTSDFNSLVCGARQLLIVVPSHGFRAVLQSIHEVRTGNAELIIAWGTKGFDTVRSMLLSDVVSELFGSSVSRAVISGPSFAGEVARELPTAMTVASDRRNVAEHVAGWLRNHWMRVYTNDDMAGVQLGGAIKNVMALAAGISDGLGFGANARAALITRGLAEMNRLGVALGGKPPTFMGLTGVGDLILTCTDDQSRNRRVGIGLGHGKSLEHILREVGQEAEGVTTVRDLYVMATKAKVEMPITEQVYKVVYEGQSPQQAVEALLHREPKAE